MLQRMMQTATVVAAQTLALGFLPMETLAATFQLEEATVSDINTAFDAGVLTSEKLIELYLNRIDAYDDSLNSLITVNPDALAIARALDLERQTTGPRSVLHGIPVILKDNFDTFDMPTTGGSITLEGSIPPDDAFTVQRLRDAGAVILAKANLNEFASGGGRSGYSSLGGLHLNPYNLLRSPAGSSGGTGAAIAANLGVIGTGTDTGGSIRGPASVNGIVGIKPTQGLVSRDGIIPLALSFDTGGPMTRTVTDAAITLGFMTGVDPADPLTSESEGKFFGDYTPFLKTDALQGSRIGVARNFFGGDPEVDTLINNAIAKLEELGATIVDPITYPQELFTLRDSVYSTVLDGEFKSQIETYLATLPGDYPKTLGEIIAISEDPNVVNSDRSVAPGRIAAYKAAEASGGLTNPVYIDAIEKGIPTIRNSILNIMDTNNLDAIVYPTRNCPADPIYTIQDPTYVCNPVPSPRNFANITGFPDIQVPAGFTSDNLPVTISFFGRAYSEPTLLGYAYAYEQATQFRSPPPLFPALPGETIEHETVPEPGMIPALVVLGITAFGVKSIKRGKE